MLFAGLVSEVFTVANPGATRAWWREAGLSDPTMESLELAEGPGREPAITETGARHVCLRTADIAVAHERLAAAGARFLAGPQRLPNGLAIAYFRDPAGLPLQLIELDAGPLAAGAPPPIGVAFGALHHVGVTVADLDATLERLAAGGAEPVVRAHAEGPDAARPLGLADVTYDAAVLPMGQHWLELMTFHEVKEIA